MVSEQTERDTCQRIEHCPDDCRNCSVSQCNGAEVHQAAYSCPRCNDGAGVENSGTCLEFRLDFLIHGKISFFAAGHGEMSSLQHLGFSGCCGNATRKGEQRAARNPPFRYKNSGTRHFWRAPLGLIRILHPNHITGSIRCHLNPYQSVAGRCCSLLLVDFRSSSLLAVLVYCTALHAV